MQNAAGPPARKHVAPATQSPSEAQGNAHFPACVLHRCERHCASLWQVSAVGPGAESMLDADGAGRGADAVTVGVGAGATTGGAGAGGGSWLHAASTRRTTDAGTSERMLATVLSCRREAKGFC